MGGDEEIGGGKGRRVQRRAMRGAKTPRAGKPFTKERRQAFLDHFAASCNATAAAEAVGISENCVYRWRRKDAQFRDGWQEALDQGTARLDAELVREAAEAVKIRPNGKKAVRVSTMDAKTALAVLEAYRRSRGRNPGAVWAQPYDMEDVERRLEKKMRMLGMLPDQQRPGQAGNGGGGA